MVLAQSFIRILSKINLASLAKRKQKMAKSPQKLTTEYLDQHRPEIEYPYEKFESGELTTAELTRFAKIGYGLMVTVFARARLDEDLKGDGVSSIVVPIEIELRADEPTEEWTAVLEKARDIVNANATNDDPPLQIDNCVGAFVRSHPALDKTEAGNFRKYGDLVSLHQPCNK